MKEIIFATHNDHKLKEISALFGDEIQLTGLSTLNFHDEIPEDFETLEENALQKARHIFDRFKKPCFADDTGLEIFALNGRPGVYSARYGGMQRNSASNIKKVLHEMEGKTDRDARFRTVIAYLDMNGRKIFEGIIKGKIITSTRGKSGFGYDPIFIPDGYNITFAEMPLTEKNKISHRALAFNQLKLYLASIHT